jgi:hypothetical protein
VLFADESVFVFVFVGSKMMECAFAAVKSVTELLPLPSSTKPAKHVRVMRLEKATDSRRNIFRCKYQCPQPHFLSSTHITQRVALYLELQSDHCIMKLDTRALRYLTADDWRVLAAVCSHHLDGSHVLSTDTS